MFDAYDGMRLLSFIHFCFGNCVFFSLYVVDLNDVYFILFAL